jgi:hypothetical protein
LGFAHSEAADLKQAWPTTDVTVEPAPWFRATLWVERVAERKAVVGSMGNGIDRIVEARIREARERGDLDDLPGHGKPLNLDDLNGLTAEQRFEALLLRSCGELAPEVALTREIRAFRERLASCESEAERARLREALQNKAAELSALVRGRR